jgi:hypothetical protein
MAIAATALALGSAAPYGPTQGARGWFCSATAGWFACFVGEMKLHQKLERKMVHRP